MKLLEIKNNLIKLSYEDGEQPVLGRFLVLTTDAKSYVAQFVNLKSDNIHNFAIARLLFTFTSDGVVDNYDGSIPSMKSELSMLTSDELLDLLPVETPIKIGTLAQQDSMLNLDISCFEHNFTVFVEQNSNKATFISNCVRQLFQMKEKSVIIDIDNLFEDYSKIKLAEDFKLPLNSEMIDYLFEYELEEVDASTKAVIQDIFYAVQQYIKSLDFEFLPIDNFVDVVANQYKETQMPELALLKNKLLKYRDANVFANTKEEVLAFSEKLNEKNCSIIDLKDINDSLQKEVISFVHDALNLIDKYIYFFVPLNDGNSDKKLLKKLINHNHVFTTFLASHDYKYTKELKSCADNLMLFAPQSQQNDFAYYNTFLTKLNLNECIVYGRLTQGIPFIIELSDLDLDLTKDDVLGDRALFVPKKEDTILVRLDEEGNKILLEDSFVPVDENGNVITEDILPAETEKELLDRNLEPQKLEPTSPQIIEPVSNIMEDSEPLTIEETPVEEISNDDLTISDIDDDSLSEDILEEAEEPLNETAELTEDDLDFIEDTQPVSENFIEEPVQDAPEQYEESPFVQEQTPVVPVYPAEETTSTPSDDDSDVGFSQGDAVSHPRYGRGVVEKIIKYGNKTLCSISFENVGRRLLDPTISEFTKI